MPRRSAIVILIGMLVYGACLIPAHAQQAAAFYKGKQNPGTPVIIARNMEGAGSLRLANWLYRVAPKDGTAFGTIGRGIAFDPIMGGQGAQFTATEFGWIGSANDEV